MNVITNTELEEKHESLQAEASHLSNKKEELERISTHEYPRVNHARSLFGHISKITWDDDCDGQGNDQNGKGE